MIHYRGNIPRLNGSLLWIFFVFFSLFSFSNLYPAGNDQITVVFRYDDVSYNINIEKYLINTFNKYNIPITFGVVVGNRHLNSSEIQELRSADKKKEVEIAMHGFAHTRTELFGTYDEQYKLLKKGRDSLESAFHTSIEAFIPPYNRYTLNTLKALEALKFKTLSADETGPFDNSSKLIFLPETSTLASLKRDINKFRKENIGKCIIVVLFHHYDFTEDDKEQGIVNESEFDSLISWVTQQSDVNVKSLGEASQLIDGKNFLNYSKVARLQMAKYLPFAQHLFTGLYYIPPAEAVNKLELKLWLFLIVYYLSVIMIVFFTVYYISHLKFVHSKTRTVSYSSTILLLVVLVLVPVRFIGTLLVVIIGVPLFLYLLRNKVLKERLKIPKFDFLKARF
jgi:peptidoglycan/xylan/chitin deacetylase (PgdA/CDA1 family)